MKYWERQYAKYEKKYCEKHGRLKFLKTAKKQYKFYIAVAILDGLLAVIYTAIGISALLIDANYIQFPNYIWYFSISFLWLLQAIMWSVRLPFYKRKSIESKKELESMKENEEM